MADSILSQMAFSARQHEVARNLDVPNGRSTTAAKGNCTPHSNRRVEDTVAFHHPYKQRCEHSRVTVRRSISSFDTTPGRRWILAGDLNTNGNRQTPDYARLSDQYSVMMNVLGRPRDLWTGSYTLTSAPGFTSAAGNDFTGETVGGGSRLDYILVHGPPPPPPATGIHSPGERRPRRR
jgi:hypothetical protein